MTTRDRAAGVLATLLMAFAAGPASAAMVLYEPFKYTAGQGLSGQAGQIAAAGVDAASGNPDGQVAPNGNSWMSTGWTGTPGGTTYSQANDASTNATDLTYLNLLHTPSGSSQQGGLGYSPRLAVPYFTYGAGGASNDVYYSMLVRINDLSTTNAAGGLIAGFNNTRGSQAGNPTTVGAAVFAKPSGNGFIFGSLKQGVNGGAAFYESTVRNLGETYLIVGKYTINGTLNVGGATPTTDDAAQIWVNPTSLGGLAPGGALLANNGGADIPNNAGDAAAGSTSIVIQSFLLRQTAGVNSATNSAVTDLLIDELRIGSTYADVTPVVPEAGALAVWSLIGVVAFGMRKYWRQ